MVKCCLCNKRIKDFTTATQNPFFFNWWHNECKLQDDEKVKGITELT